MSLAFAATDKPLSTSEKAPLKNEFRQPKGNLEATLKLGVSSNIITQAQANKIGHGGPGFGKHSGAGRHMGVKGN